MISEMVKVTKNLAMVTCIKDPMRREWWPAKGFTLGLMAKSMKESG
jgi:hypothetical protein